MKKKLFKGFIYAFIIPFFIVTPALALEYFVGTADEIAQIIGNGNGILGYRAWDGEEIMEGGTIEGNLIPLADNTYDLGTTARSWRNLVIEGTATIGTLSGASLTLSGDLTVQGNTTLGDATSDTITPTGRFAADIDPSGNNVRDIGAYGYAWQDIYASGSIYATGFKTNYTHPIKGTTVIEVGNTIYPTGNNAIDLGAYDYAFKDIYASGTVYASSALVEPGTASAPSYSFTGDTNTGMYRYSSNFIKFATNGIERFIIGVSYNASASNFNPTNNNVLKLGKYGAAWKDIYASGTLKIGDATFAIAGLTATSTISHNLRASSFWIQGTGYAADFVFEDDYPLMTIDEYGNFIAENKHLPNMPSGVEGYYLADQNEKLLEAIEIQALYILDLQKQIDELKTGGIDIEKLKQEIKEKLVEELLLNKSEPNIFERIKRFFLGEAAGK